MNRKLVGIGAAIVLAITATAAIASYTTREVIQAKTDNNIQAGQSAKTAQHHPKQQGQKLASAAPQQPAQRCDDNNIVGTAAGGVGGGVVGSQFGRGSGKTAATIAGVIGGAYLGNQYIPTRNVTCPH
jgi:uncharacterized protein YcfJ